MQYIDVVQDPAGLKTMMGYSKGKRKVPVIVENGNVTIGYGGT